MEGGVRKGAEVTTEEAAQASNEGSGERWIHGQCLPKTFEVSFAVFYNYTGNKLYLQAAALEPSLARGGGIYTNNICQQIRAWAQRARTGWS